VQNSIKINLEKEVKKRFEDKSKKEIENKTSEVSASNNLTPNNQVEIFKENEDDINTVNQGGIFHPSII
jgi:1,2-phenylacetyl-CoA epoxidase catalytic subunit